jgi:hypothetical protein
MPALLLRRQRVQISSKDAFVQSYCAYMIKTVNLCHFIFERNSLRIPYSRETGVPMSNSVHLSFFSISNADIYIRELLLVEGALLQGIGNWQAIAEHIGTRTKDDIEKHYKEVYINSPDWPLPVCCIAMLLASLNTFHRLRVKP